MMAQAATLEVKAADLPSVKQALSDAAEEIARLQSLLSASCHLCHEDASCDSEDVVVLHDSCFDDALEAARDD